MPSNRIFLPGNRYLVPFLAFLGAFAPITTDMYLPALPVMAEVLQTSNELISLTMSSFMLTFALSMLIWGPISDKYGRKPALFAGMAIYVGSSMALAMANSIGSFIAWRIVQAIGSASASTASLAIVKDVVRGPKMEKMVSVLQAATVIAPVVAPIIGGWLLVFVSWRGIFWALAGCGALAFFCGLLLRETAPLHSSRNAVSLKGVGAVLTHKPFLYPLLLFSLMAMPFMSYLGASPFIFQNYFKVSPQQFSFFFALNAALSILGPFAHIYIFRHFNRNTLIGALIFSMFLAGCLLLAAGYSGPWVFTLIFSILSFTGSALRPPSTVLMLESINGNNGLVASLINCGALLCGSLAMSVATLAWWPNPVLAVGCIAATVSGGCFAFWLAIRKPAQSR